MINMFKIRKYVAIIIPSFVGVIMYIVGSMYYGLFGGLGFFFLGLLLSLIMSSLLLSNPFSSMIEGNGILVMDWNSTGVIRPFIVKVVHPYIRGVEANGEPLEDVFDRSTVQNLAAPVDLSSKKDKGFFGFFNGLFGRVGVVSSGAFVNKSGGVDIRLDEEDYNRGRFALFQYPCLIYNSQIKSLITKDALSDAEKGVFANHTILYLNHKVNELSTSLLNFGRYVVDNLKPKQGLLGSKWLIGIVIVLVIILVALFAPAVIEQISSGGLGGAGKAIAGIGDVGGSVVTPR